ncbi:hypothetical protein J4229_03655 [Candidatus Pacearchaeota archaeon]|nr:hypothetical protein [Candidatus Pacearchaeota archaeon]
MNQIEFKKNIKLDNDLAWLIGFYLAEGTKTKGYIGVANNELNLITKSLDLFEKSFGINKNSWTIWIKTNRRDDKGKEFVRQKWSKKIRQNFKIGYARFAYRESIEIRINSVKLSAFLNNILKQYPERILKNKELTLNFLKGYIIGDGGITLRQKQIHNISITVKEKEYRDYLIKALKLLYGKEPNIRKTKGAYELYYCHVNMISKIILDGLFDDLDRQKKKLINGYKNKIYTRARVKYWNKIKNKSLTSKQIAELSGNSFWSVMDALNKDIKLGIVDCEYKQLNKKGFPNKFYKLNSIGLKLLNKLEVEM